MTILRLVECKCRKTLGAQDIRAEFGKAVDLRVFSYLIWSLKQPKQKVIDGAKRIGLDLVALGFDEPQGAQLFAKPDLIATHVGNMQEVVRRENRFVQTLAEIGRDSSKKMLLS